jgi:hypothetical protein
MAQKNIGAFDLVTTPALTDEHIIVQSAVTYNETNQQVLNTMASLTTKTDALVNADMIPINDSVASNVAKKALWSNIKSTLKTYFDTLYVALTGDQTIAGVKTFSSTIVPILGVKVSGLLEGSSKKLSDIWASLNTVIPNTNDTIGIRGGLGTSIIGVDYAYTASYALRKDANTIEIHVLQTVPGRVYDIITITNSATGNWSVSISW